MATSWVHLATMAASLATQVTLLANLEGHNASPKVCLGTFLGLLHRLGTRLGLAILAATSLRLAPLSKWAASLHCGGGTRGAQSKVVWRGHEF